LSPRISKFKILLVEQAQMYKSIAFKLMVNSSILFHNKTMLWTYFTIIKHFGCKLEPIRP